jgi:hypothetical protein
MFTFSAPSLQSCINVMTLLLLDWVISWSDGDKRIVKAMNELQDFVLKAHKSALKKGQLSCVLGNNKLRSKFDKCELLFLGLNFCVNYVA